MAKTPYEEYKAKHTVHSPRRWSIRANQGRNGLSSLFPEMRKSVFYKSASGVVSGNLSRETSSQSSQSRATQLQSAEGSVD